MNCEYCGFNSLEFKNGKWICAFNFCGEEE